MFLKHWQPDQTAQPINNKNEISKKSSISKKLCKTFQQQYFRCEKLQEIAHTHTKTQHLVVCHTFPHIKYFSFLSDWAEALLLLLLLP